MGGPATLSAMVDPIQVLPPEDERAALLDALAELIDRIGVEPLVTGPLLRPSAEFFPDPWTPDLTGVRRLALRLLRYAGLDEFEVSIELFEDERPKASALAIDPYEHSERHSGAAAWFAGIRGGVVYFGANVDKLDDPLGLTAALAHETSHAFRSHHDLMVDELAIEEQLTDLTTVFLGFGLLTTNVALRHRSAVVTGALGGSQYEWSALGYLSPQALSFLLACHQRLRGAKVRAVTGELESNQAMYYRKARGWLDAQVPDLPERLGMPPRSQWPEPWSLEELVGPLDEDHEPPSPEPSASAVPASPRPAEVERRSARSKPVLRVPDSDNRSFQLWVAILGLIGALVSTNVSVVGAVAVAVATVVVVRRLGGRKTWTCSACEAKVRREQTSCPECNGMFVMDLEDAADRLDVDPWQVLAERHTGDASPGEVYRALPAQDPRVERGPAASELDGSGVPREQGIMMPSEERVRVVDAEQVDVLEGRIGARLPHGYREYVTSLGEGTDSGVMQVLTPRQIIEELDGYAPRLAALGAEGMVVIARSERGDLLLSEDGTLHEMSGDDGSLRGGGGDLQAAIEALLERRGVDARWFLPVSAEPMTTLLSSKRMIVQDLLDLLLEFSPVYLEEQREDGGARWLVLSPGLGGLVRIERDAARWRLEIVTDREHREIGRRLVFALREHGFEEAP